MRIVLCLFIALTLSGTAMAGDTCQAFCGGQQQVVVQRQVIGHGYGVQQFAAPVYQQQVVVQRQFVRQRAFVQQPVFVRQPFIVQRRAFIASPFVARPVFGFGFGFGF